MHLGCVSAWVGFGLALQNIQDRAEQRVGCQALADTWLDTQRAGGGPQRLNRLGRRVSPQLLSRSAEYWNV